MTNGSIIKKAIIDDGGFIFILFTNNIIEIFQLITELDLAAYLKSTQIIDYSE